MNRPSARIGYARVSTADQNLDAQMAALEAAGCTMIRPETGETLVVTRIDRLARSMRDLHHGCSCVMEGTPERHASPSSPSSTLANKFRSRVCIPNLLCRQTRHSTPLSKP